MPLLIFLCVYERTPRCSSRILHPMSTRTRPPASSAQDLPREPTTAPALTPTAERRKVVRPIRLTASRMSTWRKAKVMHGFGEC